MPDTAPRSSTAYRLIPLGILVLAGVSFILLGGHRYVSFAGIADNKEWLSRPRAEWDAASGDALAKFVAAHDRRIVQGPRSEDTNPYNRMVEIDGAIR